METLENIQKYYAFYLESKSITKTSHNFNKCTKYLKKWFIENNLSYPNENFNKKVSLNSSYFRNIDCQNKAYILGFIYADGCLHKRRRIPNGAEGLSLSFNIKITDREILEFIKKELNYGGILGFNPKANFLAPNGKNYERAEQIRISITSLELCRDLINLGVLSNKSNKEMNMPNIPSEFIPHFIRGYFDGDGSISLAIKQLKYRVSCRARVSFCCNSKIFLEEIQKYLKLSNINSSLSGLSRNNYTLHISEYSENIIKFCKYLYTDSKFYLKRKNDKFIAHYNSNIIDKIG